MQSFFASIISCQTQHIKHIKVEVLWLKWGNGACCLYFMAPLHQQLLQSPAPTCPALSFYGTLGFSRASLITIDIHNLHSIPNLKVL